MGTTSGRSAPPSCSRPSLPDGRDADGARRRDERTGDTPLRGFAWPVGMGRRRALDVARVEAVLQRLRRSQRSCVRVRRHASSRASMSQTASASGRVGGTAPARWFCCPIRMCCWCSPRTASWRWSARRPIKYMEIARFKAIEGKTWNHPALIGDVLLVRNGEEMAAFRLARAGR